MAIVPNASGGFCSCCNKPLGSGLRYPSGGKVYCFDCFQIIQQKLLAEESKKKDLYDYIKKIFKVSEIPVEVISGIDRAINTDNKKLSGIKYTLYYYYEILGLNSYINSIPFIIRDHYDSARKYVEQQNLTKRNNESVDINVPSVKITLDPKELNENSKPKFKYNMEDL